MRLARDLHTISRLVLGSRHRGGDHAARMEHFYANQAEGYDDFRKRLLPGRAELLATLELPAQAVIVDLGGGTGANLELLPAPVLARIKKWFIVDLSVSLLEIAARRKRRNGWQQVEIIHGDATIWQPEELADLVLFSYSLTMIPDWQAALRHAANLLKPNGQIAVVDFTVSHNKPLPGLDRSGLFTRNFWPRMFAWDSVFLNPDHLPYLLHNWHRISLVEGRTRLPYIPGSRVPYYRFVGRKI